MTQTWNDAGVTFTSLKLNVTDTASASGSLLLDLQVGSSSKFSVSKAGVVTLGGSATFAKQVASNYIEATTGWSVSVGGSAGAAMTPNVGFSVGPNSAYAFASGNSITVLDIFLRRDAAGVLAQRNSTNAQTFNIYNTYTDGSNYERGFLKWASNELVIGTESLGTGTDRKVKIKGGTTVQLQLETDITYNRSYLGFGTTVGTALASLRSDVSGVLRLAEGISTSNGAAHELIEMTAPSAPSADRVRIYAEDNGSGKTRLMALFATGVAQQIAIEP